MILIGFGSNLRHCALTSAQIVHYAARAVAGFAPISRMSSLYRSPAWPDPRDPAYVNAAAICDTPLSPAALLLALHLVEAAFGRRRSARNAPRTLDLDLLAYGDEVQEDAGLILPHAAIETRPFVLAPIAEIAPDWRHPVTRLTASQMNAVLDQSGVARMAEDETR